MTTDAKRSPALFQLAPVTREEAGLLVGALYYLLDRWDIAIIVSRAGGVSHLKSLSEKILALAETADTGVL